MPDDTNRQALRAEFEAIQKTPILASAGAWITHARRQLDLAKTTRLLTPQLDEV